MNLDDLTIGQARELAGMFGGTHAGNIEFPDAVGKYVIVRSRSEGVNAGIVVKAGIGFIELQAVRRLWYHKPAVESDSWYEGVAKYGLSDDSKISGFVETKLIVEDYSVIKCTDIAEESIRQHPTHKQTINPGYGAGSGPGDGYGAGDGFG